MFFVVLAILVQLTIVSAIDYFKLELSRWLRRRNVVTKIGRWANRRGQP